jgi:hypothetical protein
MKIKLAFPNNFLHRTYRVLLQSASLCFTIYSPSNAFPAAPRPLLSARRIKSPADRRKTVRRNIRTPIRVRKWKSEFPEQESESENLSEHGILFATDEAFPVGTVLDIQLQMPELITCEPVAEWLCSGHVVRVQPIASTMGKFGVGVQFDCYQVARGNGAPAIGGTLPTQASRADSDESLDEKSRELCLRAIQSLTAKASK